MNKNKFPIDEAILEKVERELGYEKEKIRGNILANKFDTMTTNYYLFLPSWIKKGESSVSNLESNAYIQFINDEKNIVGFEENQIQNFIVDDEKEEHKKKRRKG